MSKLLEIALGLVTGIGGFLEAGSLATSAQAGAAFGFQLAWAIALGTICIAFLVEMAGRLAAVSKHTLPDAMRERFGIRFFTVPLVAVVLVSFLVLASELGGVALALQLATGIKFQWWAPVAALAVWLLLWAHNFSLVEKGASLLGLVTLVFAVAAFKLHVPLNELGAHLLPSLPRQEGAKYWFMAVSIIGASVSPYLFYFYSAGAVEDHWDEDYLGVNRIIAGLGMGFGGTVAVAVLAGAAMVFHSRGIQIDRYEQIPLQLAQPLGHWGFILFVASLGIACFGAALEIALQIAYLVAQGFGWKWGENLHPKDAARFSLVYTVAILLAGLLIFTGIDPLKLTIFSMALTALSLPVTVVPLLIIMNDPMYLGENGNHWIANAAVLFISLLACIVAIVAIPLQIVGS
ncbi:MAG TPA: divalent metal cation transporter [Gemmatimonadales bacterium]|jgi:Mn2+/Fe2+ NRAMP family transporter|nr:divalent metal cation transporter [Gemmatimonadales bacterium]